MKWGYCNAAVVVVVAAKGGRSEATSRSAVRAALSRAQTAERTAEGHRHLGERGEGRISPGSNVLGLSAQVCSCSLDCVNDLNT